MPTWLLAWSKRDMPCTRSIIVAMAARPAGGAPTSSGSITSVSDLGVFIGRAQREHPDTPVILLGHSMGGAVALACALRYHKVLRGLVLSAPALAAGEALPAFKVWMVKLLSAIAPNTGVLTLPASAVSRDPAIVQAYESDPLVFRGSIPARTLAELLLAMQRFQQTAPELRVPVLVQHGTADSLVPLAAVTPSTSTSASRRAGRCRSTRACTTRFTTNLSAIV